MSKIQVSFVLFLCQFLSVWSEVVCCIFTQEPTQALSWIVALVCLRLDVPRGSDRCCWAVEGPLNGRVHWEEPVSSRPGSLSLPHPAMWHWAERSLFRIKFNLSLLYHFPPSCPDYHPYLDCCHSLMSLMTVPCVRSASFLWTSTSEIPTQSAFLKQ